MSDYRRELREYIVSSIQGQLKETSAQAEQPPWIKVPLRPHQLTLLAAARVIESRSSISNLASEEPQLLTKYGVLADRVGSGKSLVALGLVKDPPPENMRVIVRQGNSHSDSMTMCVKKMPDCCVFDEAWTNLCNSDLVAALPRVDGKIHINVSLAIVPHNICPQWETYIKDHSSIKTMFIKRTKDCDIDEGIVAKLLKSELVLISATMLKKFMNSITAAGLSFERIVWSRLFIDEADSIACTTRYGEISARFTWFITASWLNILFPSGIHSFTMNSLPEDLRPIIGTSAITGISSRYGFIYNTLSDVRSPYFTPLIVRNSDAWIEQSLQTPVITHDTIICKAPANLTILKGFISPTAMEALHAGDTTGALDALGLKTTTKETLVEKVTGSLRGELLQAERLLEFKKTMEYSTPAVKVLALEKAEQKVQRLKEQLISLEMRIASVTQDNCPICYDTLNTATLTPCCRNSFCLSCLCECISTKPICPLCRTNIASVSDLIVVGSGDVTHVEIDDKPTKGAALLELLQNSNPDQRYLVFSAHEASFKGLRELLSARGIRCELLSGSGARVERLRSQFKDGTIRVLCMNARHVGAGINLEAATHVVLYHRMNMELEKQVIGRAVRFERSAELKIIHLVHEAETISNGEQSSEVIMHV